MHICTYRVENVDLGLVDEKALKQQGDDGGALTQHQHRCIEPGGLAVEKVEQRDLGQVGPDKQIGEDEKRQQDAGKQTTLEIAEKERIRDIVPDSLS